MLTVEQNERLTRVGPRTPMGELFRRYWQPVAASADLKDDPVKQVRILGETLVLFRDRQGRLGLVGERCPHRGTAMAFGIPEPEGLRCAYHGWLFDREGRCVAQPDLEKLALDSAESEHYAIAAYPVEELGGLIWAYLGPTPAPLLPRWELLVQEGGQRSIGSVVVPCNWLQCMENGLDEAHVEWLHGYFGNYMLERQGRKDLQHEIAIHRKYDFETYEFGMLRRHTGTNDPPAPIIFPNITAGGMMLFRVPIDDTHTWAIQYRVHRVRPGVEMEPQDVVPVYKPPLPGLDDDGHPTWPTMDVSGMQDMVMWYARGPIADRTHEELDENDSGIVLHRKLLEENMDRVARGEDPMGVFRDPAKNVSVAFIPRDGDGRAERPERGGSARNYVAAPDRYDPVATHIRELAAARR